VISNRLSSAILVSGAAVPGVDCPSRRNHDRG
jgi:hypothetical protein